MYFSNIGFPFTGNGNPSGRSGGRLPLHRGAKGAPAGVQRIFRISGFLSRENGTPQAAAAASSPCAGEPRGLLRGAAYFSNIGLPFTGEWQPLRPQRRPAPLTQGSQGASAGVQRIFEYRTSFHGRMATPQAAAAASSPCTGEPRGLLRGYSVFFEYRASFHGGKATPQAAAAASSPYTGEPGEIRAGDPVEKKGFRR